MGSVGLVRRGRRRLSGVSVVPPEGEEGGRAQLKPGPGKAWMTARPRRKSRDDTHPGATTYSRRSGMTTGPPPKMMVPARYMFVNKSNARGGGERTPRVTMNAMNVTRCVGYCTSTEIGAGLERGREGANRRTR